MSKRSFYIQTLGCAKNVADTDGINAVLERAGMQSAAHPADADVLIVNTCGFLQSARTESLDTLRELGAGKQNGQLLIAAGCLISRYGEVVQREVPAVDGVIDAGKWLAMPRFIEWLEQSTHTNGDWFDESYLNLPPDQIGARSVTDHLPRLASGPSAFLKIADGCDRPCTFCIIPAIKGMHRSKPMDAVIAEARELVSRGALEIVLVAQDTTAYGWDWGKRDQLAPLIERLCTEVEGLRWLRLMYAYPGHVTPRLIEVMARYPQILHYLDIPLQHAHPQTLHRMKRPNSIVTHKLLDDLHTAMPDIAIRTTFIVGFPGETDEEFEGLLAFIEEQQFDRVGIFEFSREEGTPAGAMSDQIEQKVKAQRRAAAMELQQGISLAKNKTLVGRTLDVLVEGVGEMEIETRRPRRQPAEAVSIGRTYRDAPEVDGMVIIRSQLHLGQLAQIKITQGSEYDLIGVPA
ncbi:MAG: 30S ribosomal protein S12 methylthiotransferase RimO [Anaerolineae bacterium]